MINFIIENSAKMGVKVDKNQAQKLLIYANLIVKWNKTYNLTATITLDEVLKIHILDSLAIVNFIQPTNLLDVGSGAGLPSVILAIMLPDLIVTAVDSVGKKTRFMQFAKTSLQLNNFSTINARIENIKGQKFTQITSRAFATIKDNIDLSSHLLEKDGKFLLMKGANWQQEKTELANYKIKPHKLNIPFVSNQRFLLEII